MFKQLFYSLMFVSICNNYAVAQETSLREQIGQMIILGFDGMDVNSQSAIVKAIEQDNLGGVILFDYNQRMKTFNHNISSAKQVQQLTQHLQQYTQQFNQLHHRDSLPLLITVDYEGGKVNRFHERYGFPFVPSAADVGKMSDTDALNVITTMRKTLNNTGVNVDCAPVLDLNTNQTNPIIGMLGRSFSSNPLTVVKYAQMYSKEFTQHNIQCAYKHFPGHGSSTTDSHQGFVDISATWSPKELIPYQKLLNQEGSCNIVMSAHVVNRQLDPSGLPATLSHKMLTDLLRNKLKFKGLIVTDDLQMKAIDEHYDFKQTLTLAINAGADLLMIGNQLSIKPINARTVVDLIESQVKAGKINPQRIAESYQRIRQLKAKLRGEQE